MKVRRSGDYPVMLWANNGGTAREVAIWPPTASLLDFDWRVSIASLLRPGLFSSLPVVDRVLTVVNGNSLELRVDSRLSTLDRRDQIRFRGEELVEIATVDSDIDVLNVMTRRDRWDAHVRWAALDSEVHRLGPVGKETVELLIVVSGCLRACEVSARAVTLQLGPLDVMQLLALSEIEGTGEIVHILLTRSPQFVPD